MDPTTITSTFVILSESYCSQDGEHERAVATALTKGDAMRKVLTIPHNGKECDCNFSTDEVDETTISCFSYPMIIREFDLCTDKQLSSHKFFNSDQVMDELDRVAGLVKFAGKR